MSRVGKNPIILPEGVKVVLKDGILSISGRGGTKEIPIYDKLDVEITDTMLKVTLKEDNKLARMMWGTTQRNVRNAVNGFQNPYEIKLSLSGVGYRAQMRGKNLVLSLGYSHEIEFDIPDNLLVKCEKPTLVVIAGADKAAVGQTAAEIQSLRRTEPYKGKGVYPEGKEIYRKEGKKN